MTISYASFATSSIEFKMQPRSSSQHSPAASEIVGDLRKFRPRILPIIGYVCPRSQAPQFKFHPLSKFHSNSRGSVGAVRGPLAPAPSGESCVSRPMHLEMPREGGKRRETEGKRSERFRIHVVARLQPPVERSSSQTF